MPDLRYSKVVVSCPNCRNPEPKELVEVQVKHTFPWVQFFLTCLITCGIALLSFPLLVF